MLYVVDAEFDFVPQVAKLLPDFGELKATHDKLAGVMNNQAEYNYLNDQWTLCNEQLRNVQAEIDAHPTLSNNELRQNWNNLLNAEKQLRYQYNELGREVNLRYPKTRLECREGAAPGRVPEEREDFLAKSKELRSRPTRSRRTTTPCPAMTR